ncbi:MAG: response regulator [Chloroflexota bacterium]
MATPIRIAVVNHDAVFLRLVAQILETQGYDALLCPGGTAAHDVIVREQPDMIMIDTWLESRDTGWALLQTLRLDAATAKIPILVCSSDADEVMRQANQLEAMPRVGVLPKPFDPSQLLKKITELLAAPVV